MANFSSKPKTEWHDDHHLMTLIETLSYKDSNGKVWEVPSGAELNGATIPKALWSRIGSPYIGKYRRASIIHDYYVGEGSNPDVSRKERKAADRMFYDACLTDGCTKFFARILYLGVCIGTWGASRSGGLRRRHDEEYKEDPNDKMIQEKFDKSLLSLEAEFEKEFADFDELDILIEKELFA